MDVNTKQKPIFETKLRQIRAAVFRNEGKDGKPFFSTQLVRRFKSADGEWASSSSFTGRADLYLAKMLIDEVLGFLQDNEPTRIENKNR